MPNHKRTMQADSAFAILNVARDAIAEDVHPYATQFLQRESSLLAQSQHTADFANLILERLAHRLPSRTDEQKNDRAELLTLFRFVASKATQGVTERKIKRDLKTMVTFMKDLRNRGLNTSAEFSDACVGLAEVAKMYGLEAELPEDLRTSRQPQRQAVSAGRKTPRGRQLKR